MPPSASVRPRGEPSVIEPGLPVEWKADFARVESVDRAARTLALSARGVPLTVCRIGGGVDHWRDLDRGDPVRARITELLTVYLAPAEENGRHARVLAVDPSYRLLTVQYPRDETQTFKLELYASMRDIEAGDSVAIGRVEIVTLHLLRRSSGSAP